jgi:hypothetical protein
VEKFQRYILFLVVAFSLTGCNSNSSSVSAHTESGAVRAASANAQTYENSVQQIYLAYFGRPAEPAGLTYFENLLLAAGAPSDIQSLTSAYMQPGGVHDIIDVFSNSSESQALYAGDNSAFIEAVYLNLFNRSPDQAGKTYWSGLLNSGAISRANAALAILGGAQGSDIDTIATKLNFSRAFTTAALDVSHKGLYDGLVANAVVRGSLRTVRSTTSTADVADLSDRVFATLAGLMKATADQMVIAPVAAPSMGDYLLLTPIIRSADGAFIPSQAVTMRSANTSLAKLTSSGTLIALQGGTVTVNASTGALATTMSITIRERYAASGEILATLGPEETVFDYARDRCDDGDVPDIPARAIRRGDGQILLLAVNDPHSYVSIGPDFSSLKRRCIPALTSRDDRSPTSFHNREWLSGLYRVNDTMYGLVHNEFHDAESIGCLNGDTGPGNPCWYNAVTAAKSSDGGLSFTAQSSPSELVAPPVVRWDATNPNARSNPHGSFNPSNIISGPNGYYYATFISIPDPNNPGANRGVCVMRTQNLGDPGSWRAWDGAGFNLQMQNPYAGTPTAACKAVLPDTNASLSYNTYFGQYLLLGVQTWVEASGALHCGVYYSLSPDLVRWSGMRKLKDIYTPLFNGSSLCPPPGGGYAGAEPYAALIDHDSSSVNFDTTGQTAYLYLTRYIDAKSPNPRNLVRMPVTFLKSATQGSDYTVPLLYIDFPVAKTNVAGSVNVTGWAIDDTGIAKVELFVDGQLAGTAAYGTPRPDVQQAYPWAVVNSGYQVVLDTTRQPNGSHTLTVRASDQSGNHAEQSIVVTVAN